MILSGDVCRCQTEDSLLSEKPLHMEIEDKNVVLQLLNVLAMASIESQIAVLFNDTDFVSLALYAVSENTLMLREPRIHKVYKCRDSESELSNVIPASVITVVTPVSFFENSQQHCVSSAHVLQISDQLFSALFGIDLNLSRCPVILLRGHNGLVLWLPMKAVVGDPSSVQVFCGLGDSLVCILTLSNDCLVLIGHHGHILVISLDSSETTPSYHHYDILGPVQCCTSFDYSYMLYSTGNELYVADVGQSIKSNQPCSIKSTALGMSGVTAFSSILSREDNRTAHCKLLVFLFF